MPIFANPTTENMPTLSQEITKKILRDVINGHYHPYSRLPTERTLAQKFGVTRQVVRESLKHLEAVGAVTILQRSGIVVNELPISCFFEHFELFLFKHDGSVDSACLEEIFKFRSDVFVQVVREAAKKRTLEELEELKSIAREFKDANDDPDRLLQIMMRFMGVFAQASHNRLYQMLANTGIKVLIKVYSLFVPSGIFFTPDSSFNIEQTLDAVENQDDELAVILVSRRMAEIDEEVQKRLENGELKVLLEQ
ncbi:MAG: FadR family transcriptional regulator [Proteobacteria bacterium]|nr:FadR family transcriptional regulator [Pseudomonadota bacterium]